jgi:hypothetical protein
MTQSYNLSQLANNLNSAGQLDATDGLAGAVPAANGGTGQSAYTTGDILYASGATALAKLSDVATGNALISGGVGASPSWGKIGMATHVSGTLPVANGGTGAATLAANNVLLGNGTSALQTVAPGTNGFVLTSNGSTWFSAAISVGSNATAFTANGTFTIPSGITKVKVTVVGGGAPGAAGTNLGSSAFRGGNGGAGGGAAIKWLSGLTPGNTLAVTVGGSNGTSSVASGTQTITTISASAGGIGLNGDINIRGGAAGNGTAGSGSNATITGTNGGAGGNSIFGAGGGGGGWGGAGGAGGAYGGGGGGGTWDNGDPGGPLAGGAGASGVVLFEY